MHSSNKEDEYQKQTPLSSSMLGRMKLSGNRNFEVRDGIKTLPIPGSQINHDKVDSMMEEENLSFSAYVRTKEPENIEKIIQKLKQLLQKQQVINDKELQFSFAMMLGNEYLRLYSESGQENKGYLNQAIEYTNAAISMFENDAKYKADLADCYSILTPAYVFNKEYDKAISLMEYVIENYQEIGYGPYKNWFASNKVEWLHNLAHMNTYNLKPEKTQGIVDYLSMVSGKYKNEVGISAQIALMWHYFTKEKQDKVVALSNSIENRLASLNDPAFKADKWEGIQTRMKRFEQMKTHKHQQR